MYLTMRCELLKSVAFEALDLKVLDLLGPVHKGAALVQPAVMEVAVKEDAKFAILSTDDDTVMLALEEVLVGFGPLVDLNLALVVHGEEPTLASAHKLFGDGGHAREVSSEHVVAVVLDD